MPNYAQFFEKLTTANHNPTSPQTPIYNCIGWAAEEDDRWWEPNVPDLGYYWPPAASSDMQVASLVAAFVTLGYQQCADGSLQSGIQKVAIYANHKGEWTHAARQLAHGMWTSKLGKLEDIEHDGAEALSGNAYGQVHCYMARNSARV